MANTAVGGRGSLTKKLLLWLLLVVQLCFIFCFWLLQTGFPDHTVGETTSNKIIFNKPKEKMPAYKAYEFKGVPIDSRVNFISMKMKVDASAKENNSLIDKGYSKLKNVNNFYKDFIELNTERLMNITGIEAEMLIDQTELVDIAKRIWCFRKGTVNTTTDMMIYWNIDAQRVQCKCLQHWHGKDCGQPEVIWRALMLPGNQFKLREPDKELTPHRLIYMLEGNFHSLDMLELQIKAVDNVIDLFLIYWTSQNADDNARRSLQRKLNDLIGLQNYIFYHCGRKDMHSKSKKIDCNALEALKYFKEKLLVKLKGQLAATDLLLYTNENVIYSWEPLQFFKYYATPEMSLWRFRLKYNVYGFYWQHPARTHLSGFICSFSYLENIIKFQSLLTAIHSSSTNTIGDLNHFGGWFCQYCQHPDEILKELQELPIESSSHKQFELPNGTRNRYIDSKYLEYLIAQGIHIDGKTRLEKIRQYNDRHFAPTYAQNCKWKYGNILTNFFEAMENDYIIEEAEGGAGF